MLFLLACVDPVADPPGPTFDPDPPDELGDEREAAVVLPSDYNVDVEWPLVVLLHGYGATADVQDIVFGLASRVDTLGFLLVKPEGTMDAERAQFWNATDECCDFGETGVDDVGYLAGLVAEARTLYPLSTVSFVGHSNGGFMAYRLACEIPEEIDRIAVLAGATWADEDDCPGTEPVSVLHVHGTADDTIAYASGPGHAGAEESAARWADKAGCDTTPSRADERDYLRSIDGDETSVDQWSGCGDQDVQLWSAAGGDHYFLDNQDTFKDDVAAWAIGG